MLVRLFFLLFLVSLFSGCTTIDHFYTLKYKKLTLTHSELARDGVAILPMISNYEEANYIKTAQAVFLKSMKRLERDVDFVDPSQGAKLAQEAGIYEYYKQLIDTDLQKEIPRELLVRKIGRAMGKRFLLRSELVHTRRAEGVTQLKLSVQLWDVDVGEIVWDASEESRGYVILIFPQVPAPLEKVMEVASANLIRKMP